MIASLWPVDDDVAVLFTCCTERSPVPGTSPGRSASTWRKLVQAVSGVLRGMSRMEAVAAVGALLGRTTDIPARAWLRVAQAHRAAGPERPFAVPVDCAAFGVFGDGLPRMWGRGEGAQG